MDQLVKLNKAAYCRFKRIFSRWSQRGSPTLALYFNIVSISIIKETIAASSSFENNEIPECTAAL